MNDKIQKELGLDSSQFRMTMMIAQGRFMDLVQAKTKDRLEIFRTPRAIRSNYIARVDKEKCVACGQCVESCQTNALKLGQKRCTTDPHISDTYDTDRSVHYDR